MGKVGVSGSHHGGVIDARLVNADSDLASMSSLGPLSKRYTIYLGQVPPAWGLSTFERF